MLCFLIYHTIMTYYIAFLWTVLWLIVIYDFDEFAWFNANLHHVGLMLWSMTNSLLYQCTWNDISVYSCLLYYYWLIFITMYLSSFIFIISIIVEQSFLRKKQYCHVEDNLLIIWINIWCQKNVFFWVFFC